MAYQWTDTIGIDIPEDYTDYTELDPNSNVTVTATRILAQSIQSRNATPMVYYDFGAGGITDFVHDFEVKVNTATNAVYPVFWAVSNVLEDDYPADLNDHHRVSAFFYTSAGPVLKTYLRQYESPGYNDNSCGSLATQVNYYTRIIGNSQASNFGTVGIYMYTDASRDTLAFNGEIELTGSPLSFRYLYQLTTYDNGTADKTATLDIRNSVFRKRGGTVIPLSTFNELRTNINTERTTRASLSAYSWSNVTLVEGETLDYVDMNELRTAIDEAYDNLFDCIAHYTSDDSVHYGTDNTSHDSGADTTDYVTHYSTHYTSDDSTQNTTHWSTHYTTADTTDYVTHYSSYCSVKKSYHCVTAKGIYDGSAK